MTLQDTVSKVRKMCEGCPFAKDWKNKEGWFEFNGKLVCLDWDEYCTKCRVDDSEDYVFDVVKSSQLGFKVLEK